MGRAAAGLAAFVLLTASAAAADPVFGTWTLDTARSKGSPFVCYVTTLEDLGNGRFREIASGVRPDGTGLTHDAVMAFDGGDHPNGLGNNNTTAFTRIDDQRYMRVFKREHKTYAIEMRTIAPDGNTMTATGDGTIEGKPFHAEMVFVRRQSVCQPKP